MNVGVIGGAGYVGLITGLGLAEIGHKVTNVDIDQKNIRQLENGEPSIYEEGLKAILQRNLNTGNIRFSSNIASAVKGCQVIFIAVGTPSSDDGKADLTQVVQVTEAMASSLDTYSLIVIKSTVPVGTVDLLRSILCRSKQEGKDFDIVANPEFLSEGNGLTDFFYPDRIVIGTSSEKAKEIMRSLYDPIVKRQVSWLQNEPISSMASAVPVIYTDLNSAQMIKYASNAFLATRISFINEIAEMCESLDANCKEVAQGMGYDSRIGHKYLSAGLGFGGPCLEKDLKALINIAKSNGVSTQLLQATLQRNEKQIALVITKLKQVLGDSLDSKNIAIFGLAFKSGTNDVRNSLALRVIDQLLAEGVLLHAHDPVAIPSFQHLQAYDSDVVLYNDPYEAVKHVDALLVLTDWPTFSELDYARIKSSMTTPVIIDARNMLESETLRSLGYTYYGVGQR